MESLSTSSAGTATSGPEVPNQVSLEESSKEYIETIAVNKTKVLVSELCHHFYTLGWVSGTGGSITIKAHDDFIPKTRQLIVMSASGSPPALPPPPKHPHPHPPTKKKKTFLFSILHVVFIFYM